MSEEIKNNQIPKEIKDICRSCEENIHCQNKGCAFRSLGNEYCDYILNATRLYLDLQQKVEQLEKENEKLKQENKRIFQNVNDDELLISNAMNYAEVQRLNNIINELENDLKKRKHTYENMNASINGVAVGCFTYVLKKLQELKEE